MALNFLPLTSYNRMLRYVVRDSENALITSTRRKQEIVGWINTVSSQIQNFLNRKLLLADYTEYFDVEYNKAMFPVYGVPISSITSIYEDPSGLFTTSTKALITDTEYFIGVEGTHVLLYRPLPYTARRAVQINYTGGLAASGTDTSLTISGTAGSFTTDAYVQGVSSAAIGICKTYSATNVTVEMLAGVFDTAEQINCYSTEDCTGTPLAQSSMASVASHALCDTYPEITRAAEMQVRWNWQQKTEFGLTSSSRDGTVVKNATKRDHSGSQLIDEVESILTPYRIFRLA